MFSLSCKTAIKSVVFLATKCQEERAGIREIALQIAASEHTVGKLLQTLVKQGVVNSLKGPSGGFYLSEAQRLQPIFAIVDAIDGPEVFRNCGLGLSRCSARHPCPLHGEYKKARDIIENIFKTKKVADLCEPVNSGLAYLFG
ncbi:MAG: RrF2 family transcriptional regulator [Flavisolibacter sp.]